MTIEQLHQMAHEKALQAGINSEPIPMIVGDAKGLLSNEIDYTKKVYHVSEGVCGFAWVNIKPANSKFAKYLREIGVARKDSYRGGISMSVFEFGQSLTRKEAYADAYASTLREYGIKAYAESRMD